MVFLALVTMTAAVSAGLAAELFGREPVDWETEAILEMGWAALCDWFKDNPW